METRYCDTFRPVDEDAYLRDFIRAVEHRNVDYVQFVLPLIQEQQRLVSSEVDACGHYLEIATEDITKYSDVIGQGLLLASHHGCLDIALFLLNEGADADYQNAAGDTALIKACERGHVEVARHILSFGANINKTNLVGSSALQWVTRVYSDRQLDVVTLLLSYDDIDVDLSSHKRGRTALHCSAETEASGRICWLLLDKSATVNIEDHTGTTPLHVASEQGLINNVRHLIEYGAHVNRQTKQFELTALHVAMQAGHVDVSVLLLESGADSTVTDSYGQTSVERMRRYSKLSPGSSQFSALEDYLETRLDHTVRRQEDRMNALIPVLSELITEQHRWTSLFEELFEGGVVSTDGAAILDEVITCIPLRTSESSLSVLLNYLFHFWCTNYKQTATFYILVRALRDHGMPSLADQMITLYRFADVTDGVDRHNDADAAATENSSVIDSSML